MVMLPQREMLRGRKMSNDRMRQTHRSSSSGIQMKIYEKT